MRSDERALRLLVAGIAWPPETFIRRLLVGLVDAGVEVTVGSARSPHRGPDAEPRVRWRPMPTWDAPMPLRVTRLAAMAARAALAGRSDLRTMAAAAPRGTTPRDRLRRWNMWLPFAGGRWDLIYFPWNSAAVAYLPAFDLGMPVIVSCRGAQVSIAPHNPRRAEINQGLGRSVA
ncbi:MAG TPA: hypothetical protein VLH79_11740, partial [Chthonomonadales bacterium]|nr:hypothetical protein [Chthonomonadales bacterium]